MILQYFEEHATKFKTLATKLIAYNNITTNQWHMPQILKHAIQILLQYMPEKYVTKTDLYTS